MQRKTIFSSVIFAAVIYLLFLTAKEINLISTCFGTRAWQIGFFALIVGEVLFVVAIAGVLIFPGKLSKVTNLLLSWRNRLGKWNWLVLIFLIAIVVYFFQYTIYGKVITGPATRLSVGFLLIFLGGILLSKDDEWISFFPLLQSALVVSAGFAAAVDFVSVSGNPFALNWSEGNRLWDFSIAFGRRLYEYPENKSIFVYTDIGRQIVYGLPFIFNGISIIAARLWWSLMDTLLYAALGWVLFKRTGEKGKILVLVGIWAYLFLNQGPIHAPLVVCAILVALAWGKSYWIAIPALILSGYFAQLSRFTWMFAPAMWILILEFSDKDILVKPGKSWLRAAVLTLSGLVGGVVISPLYSFLSQINVQKVPAPPVSAPAANTVTVASSAVDQGLLWYRLLPNATYGEGVLIGLVQAVLPLLVIITYLIISKRWKMHLWQKLVFSGALIAFLVVGLIISVKIGGGGDLHNLDMLLIGLLFTSAVAWKNGGRELIDGSITPGLVMKVILLAFLVIPGIRYMLEIKPAARQATDEQIAVGLRVLEKHLKNLPEDAQVLFMDQRQLLTFDYLQVPLVVEYEKKYVMDQALSGNQNYFNEYYRRLSEGYYDLIITEPLISQEKGSDEIFGEENDAWVTWVSNPTLCFYRELYAPELVRSVLKVIILVPRDDISECSSYLPAQD